MGRGDKAAKLQAYLHIYKTTGLFQGKHVVQKAIILRIKQAELGVPQSKSKLSGPNQNVI